MSQSRVRDFFAGDVRMRYLLGTLILLVVADGVLTEFLVTNRLGYEGNAFMRGLVGTNGFIAVKAAGATFCALVLWDMHRRWFRLAWTSTIAFVAIYAAIVLWNLSIWVFSL